MLLTCKQMAKRHKTVLCKPLRHIMQQAIVYISASQPGGLRGPQDYLKFLNQKLDKK